MKGRAGKGMMIIVPALAKGQKTHDPLITALIDSFKVALAEGMTDGVDAPGDMMSQEDAHQPTPQQAHPAANREGNEQRKSGPEKKCAAHKNHHTIIDQIAAIDVWISHAIFKKPAHMSMKETLYRAVRITLAV